MMIRMTDHTPRRVAIWVDHRMAILGTFVGEQFRKEEEISSDIDQQSRVEEHHDHLYHRQAHKRELLKHFYEEIVHHLGPADEILIVGPGQAKHELRRQIEHHKGLKGKVIGVETADKMTEEALLRQAESFWSMDQESGDR